MTNPTLGGNELKVVVFILQSRKNMKTYEILLAVLRRLYGQFASNNMLTAECMREYG